MNKHKLQGFTHPVVKPRLTIEQLEMLLAHLLRIPDVFNLARHSLKPELFNIATEPHYQIIWKTALELVESNTPLVLFEDVDHAYSLMEVTVSASLKDSSDISEEYHTKIFSRFDEEPGLLYWIYNKVKKNELTYKWGTDLLKDFRLEREIQDTLNRTMSNSNGGVLVNIPTFLQTLKDKQAEIESGIDDPVESGAPIGWFPKPMAKFPTNITFLDPMLKGGHARQEVYGVLGAFGSGKTSLGVMITIKGSLYQLALEAENPTYLPKIWYMFSYEATSDELRVRLWSQECTIKHDVLEEYSYEDLTSIKKGYDSLRDYEKQYFAEQLKLNPGMEIQGELERLEEKRPLFNKNLAFLDMTGTDPKNPKRGSGYVPEIVNIIETNLRKRKELDGKDYQVGGVVIDYVGLCARRYINERGVDRSEMRHLVGEFGYEVKRKIAVPHNCPVWIFHQLTGEANKRTHVSKAHYSDAQESTAFAENLVFSFAMGTKDPEFGSFFITCSKARRAGIGPAPLLMHEGDYYRIVLADHLEVGSNGKVKPKNDMVNIVSSPNESVSQFYNESDDSGAFN